MHCKLYFGPLPQKGCQFTVFPLPLHPILSQSLPKKVSFIRLIRLSFARILTMLKRTYVLVLRNALDGNLNEWSSSRS